MKNECIIYNAAVGGSSYSIILCYPKSSSTISISSWSHLPVSPIFECPSVIIKNFLHLIGGHRWCRRWTEEFQPPIKRYKTILLCTGAAVIVGGRLKNESKLRTIEVINTRLSSGPLLLIYLNHYGTVQVKCPPEGGRRHHEY